MNGLFWIVFSNSVLLAVVGCVWFVARYKPDPFRTARILLARQVMEETKETASHRFDLYEVLSPNYGSGLAQNVIKKQVDTIINLRAILHTFIDAG